MVELYGKTYPGTTSTSMRYHLGSVGAVDGANRENPDAHKEDPEGPPCQDLCHALCIRLKVSLVFMLLFSILLSFLTTPLSHIRLSDCIAKSPYSDQPYLSRI